MIVHLSLQGQAIQPVPKAICSMQRMCINAKPIQYVLVCSIAIYRVEMIRNLQVFGELNWQSKCIPFLLYCILLLELPLRNIWATLHLKMQSVIAWNPYCRYTAAAMLMV